MKSECGISCCNNSGDCKCIDINLKEFNTKNKIDMPLKWMAYKTDEQEAGSTD